MTEVFDVVAALMREQAPTRRFLPDPVDDDTLLALIELASHGGAQRRRRCEFVIVRDPDVRHQLARIYRQGWSLYKRVLRSRADDALVRARQWEADHFEDVPALVVACVRGRRPLFPAVGAASFHAPVFAAVQNLALAAQAAGLGVNVTTLPLWSGWEARRTLRLPRGITPVAVVPVGWPRGRAEVPAVPPLGNLVHLDAYGHQPFRPRHRPARRRMA